MAVTIHTSPSDYTPSGNPLTFVFSSNQTAQANFSYLVEIYVDGSLVEQNQIFPESGIYAHFDCSGVAERYCNTIEPLTATYIYDAANYIDLKCDVTEMYGTPPTAQASADDTIKTYKGKLTKSNFLSTTMSDYVFASNSLWLTLFPRDEKRYANLTYPNYYTFISNEEDLQLVLRLYDVDDAQVYAYSPSVATLTEVSEFIINNDILLAIGMTQIEIDSISYFTMQMQTTAGATQSELYTVYIDDRDYSTSAKQLVFMSSIGNLESYTFIKRSKTTSNIKGNEFEQSFGGFDDSGNYNYTDGGLIDYVKEIQNGIEVQTDWLSEAEQNWLVKELTASSLVYLYDNGNLIKVKITNTGYEYKTSENDMVFSEKFKIRISNDTSTVV